MPSELDRIANTALLDAAVKNPEVLAQILNKYGQIQAPHDDKMETEISNIKEKVYEKVSQAIITSKKQELIDHISNLIDMVMGLNRPPDRRQQEGRPFEDCATSKQNISSSIFYRRQGMQDSRETNLNPFVLVRGLAALAALEKIVNQQREKQIRGSLEE
jgi:hypothetical protein